MEGVPPPVIAGLQPLHRLLLVVVGKVKTVEQKLTGLFTILCPACRERGPVSTGKGFEWSCVHRKVTVVETQDRRFLTLSETSEALV